MRLRMLANYQPLNASIQYPGAPYTLAPFPHGHISTFISYHIGTWSFTLQDRWISDWNRKTLLTDVYVNPEVPSYNYEDLNIDKMFTIDGNDLDVYLTVQNLGNLKPPVAPNNNSTPDLYYMGLQGTTATQYDFIGRYITLGVRAAF